MVVLEVWFEAGLELVRVKLLHCRTVGRRGGAVAHLLDGVARFGETSAGGVAVGAGGGRGVGYAGRYVVVRRALFVPAWVLILLAA